ncbi:MAG TPA: hypothetical protein VN788_12520 [Verrucomicrobiae bacterium]|nr:hypothetical protein [Verrucomicrobiae bacterium]
MPERHNGQIEYGSNDAGLYSGAGDPPVLLKKRNLFDVAVYVLLIGLGALAFVLVRRSSDFVDDAYYFELAKSISEGTGYGFNFKPQTMVPPGFPLLLALLNVTIGSSYLVLVRLMTVFATVALITAYELLRSEENQAVAAVSCILLGSAPLLFDFSTRNVFSDLPYFFTSMLLLLTVARLDLGAGWHSRRMLLWLLCGASMLSSVLIRSTGIALVGGMFAWLAVSLFRERMTALPRLKLFIPLMAAALILQMMWMFWAAKNQFHEWPIHGYQENYLSQLKLKDGNNPELGLATWKDVLLRPLDNADDNAAAMVTLLTRRWVGALWYSPATSVPIALALLGLGSSFWKTGGGLVEWYFVCYEAMFLFWPWAFEWRFMLPVAPLACLYIWRGGALLWRLTRSLPRQVALSLFMLATVSCLSAIEWGWRLQNPKVRWPIAFWTLAAFLSIGLFWGGRDLLERLSLLFAKIVSVRGKLIPLWQVLGYTVVAILFIEGVAMQVKIGRANLHFHLETAAFYPDIEAAEWLKAHSALTAIVMARKEDLVYHYSGRRVVWFPPTTNAGILMDGIERYHIEYVIVTEGNDSYWKPSVRECFNAYAQVYPNMFRIVHEGPRSWVLARSSDMNHDPLKVHTFQSTPRRHNRWVVAIQARKRA